MGCMSLGAVSSACWRIRKPLALETLRSSRLWSRPASGLGEAGSVYTCHEGGGGRRRKPEQSPKLLHKLPGGSGRRRAQGRWKWRGRASRRQPGTWEGLSLSWPMPGMARRGPCASAPPPASPHPPRKRTEPEPGARRPAEPAPSPQPPAPRQAGAPGPGEGPAGGLGRLPHPLSPARWGSGAVALTWLVRGGCDGHGSGARGGTSSPGKDRLFRRGAGESGRQAAHSPVIEAAPWTPTRSFSAAARPPSHYPPPSSAAAAASTSSSAETPRPLHTLSHHAAGEPLPPTRHFRAQVARSGPGAGGYWGVGGRTLGGNQCHRTLTPAQAPSSRAPAAILGAGKLPFSLTSLWVIEVGGGKDALLHSAAPKAALPARDRCSLAG